MEWDRLESGMSLITVEEGKKKIKTIFKKFPSVTHSRVEDILDRHTTLTTVLPWPDVLTGIQERLSQPHLQYLKPPENSGVWGQSTTAALKELCDNWHIRLDAGNPVIGQTIMLAILDGSLPSKKATKIYVPGEPLAVRYYSQRDSATEHAYRMCFSSSCAMLLNYAKPGVLHGYNGDDQYLKTVLSFGDTTESVPQMKALAHYGIDVMFSPKLTWAIIDQQLAEGRPIPVGILHQGHVSAPHGFGHWIIIIGRTADGSGYVVHDPYGELDVVNGVYLNTDGKNRVYSKKNLSPRFLDAHGFGWGMIWKG